MPFRYVYFVIKIMLPFIPVLGHSLRKEYSLSLCLIDEMARTLGVVL